MKLYQHKKVGLAVLATALVLTVSVGPAAAYFTTYVTAKGGYTLQLQEQTHIEETVKDFVKHITVTNDSETASFVRCKVFCGSAYTLDYSGSDAGWSLDAGDGFWYYNDIVPAGGTTPQLLVQIGNVPVEEAKDAFNVIVITESTPVLYDEAGTPYADWERGLATSTQEFDMEEQG